jgi:penicillin-binding protein 1A
MNKLQQFLQREIERFLRGKALVGQLVRKYFRTLLTKILGRDRVQALDTWLIVQDTAWENLKDRYLDRQAPYYRPIARIWKTIWYGFWALAFYVFCLETNFLWLMGSMPSVEALQNPKVAQASEIYTADGVLIGKFYTENRTPVTYDRISPYLVNALIATEDIRFYQHSGIDPRALGGVALGLLRADSDRGGGSTITQQLSKKLFKTRRSDARGLLGYLPLVRTLIYKSKEWLTSIKLERNFTKEEILTMYFNTVDYGNNTYGINTAARSYFRKSPDSLSIQEAAVLVGLQKATTTYNPIRNPERSRERRNVVLAQMRKYGYLSQQELDSLSKLPIVLDVNFETPYDGNANYFKNAVVDFVKKWGDEKGYNLYTDGLKIYTTIDSRMQAYAEDAVAEKMLALQRLFDEHWRGQNPWIDENGKEIPDFLMSVVKRTSRYQALAKRFPEQPDSVLHYLNKKDTMSVYDWKTGAAMTQYWSAMDSINYYKRILRSGLMAMEPYSGQIKAWVGGLNYDFFQYDHVKQGRRQPGSTFKPFVYVAAIDDPAYNMGPCDRMEDKPFSKETIINGKKTLWTPKNSTGGFTYANMTLRRALGQSVNSVTVHLTDKIGPATVAKYANRLGITTKLRPEMSIGLGTFDVSLYEMVASYGTFVNNGLYTEPQLVTRIEDNNGNVVEEFVPKQERVISEESAFLMVHMLKGGIEEPGGTSRAMYSYDVFKKGNEIGGKTGTTSNNSDGWYICVTHDLVVGAWVGGEDRSIHFRSTQLGQGSRTALPLVGAFLEKVYRDPGTGIEPGPFVKPRFTISKPYQCGWEAAESDSLEFEPERDSLFPDQIEGQDFEDFTPPPVPDTIRRL